MKSFMVPADHHAAVQRVLLLGRSGDASALPELIALAKLPSNEVFLERRNFETRVELQKTVEARDGTLVQSAGERRIAEWLALHNLRYRYDAKFRIIGEFQIRPDFYLPEVDVYIEYWGMDTPQYKMSMYKKQMLYQQEGKRLVSVYPPDLPHLDQLPEIKARAVRGGGRRAQRVGHRRRLRKERIRCY